MQSARNVRLGDVVDYQNGGAWQEDAYAEFGIPVIRVTDCHFGQIDLADIKYLNRDLQDKYKKHELFEGDLLIATVGSHPTQPNSAVGRATIVSAEAAGAYLNQNNVCIRPKDKDAKITKAFLGYIGESDDFRAYILGCARGAASQVRMPLELLMNYSFFLPSINDQYIIEGLISPIDSLLKANKKRISTLEKVVHLLYQEWFVNFKYPGYEKVKLVESGHTDFGKIPEGWVISMLSDALDIAYGKNLPTKSISKTGKFPVYGANKVLGFYHESNTTEKVVLIGCRGTVANISRTRGPAFVTNNSFFIKNNSTLSTHWDYSFIEAHMSSVNLRSAIGGAAQPQLTLESISRLPILIPNNTVVAKFSGVAKSCYDLIDELSQQNEFLMKVRSLLLLKIFSGEIDIAQLTEINISNLAGKVLDNFTNEGTFV
jgi:type I restriction enzyme S subunit